MYLFLAYSNINKSDGLFLCIFGTILIFWLLSKLASMHCWVPSELVPAEKLIENELTEISNERSIPSTKVVLPTPVCPTSKTWDPWFNRDWTRYAFLAVSTVGTVIAWNSKFFSCGLYTAGIFSSHAPQSLLSGLIKCS